MRVSSSDTRRSQNYRTMLRTSTRLNQASSGRRALFLSACSLWHSSLHKQGCRVYHPDSSLFYRILYLGDRSHSVFHTIRTLLCRSVTFRKPRLPELLISEAVSSRLRIMMCQEKYKMVGLKEIMLEEEER